MNYRTYLLGAMALVIAFSLNDVIAFQQSPPGTVKGVEVLTRGPIHEAFAETVVFNPEPGLIVKKSPPNRIEELPPDQKPAGEQIAWIPGYWGWDEERSDFLWVSGVWRALPPGRQWVPGYWGKAAEGVQWTSGYWADANVNNVEYLPEPPASVEVGPSVNASSDNESWIPGCWVWQNSRYAWRPGYWTAMQANWNWVPAHYNWAPRGYVFVDGYWDYNVARRGVLYAPVYFDANVYNQSGYSYSPATVISLAVFADQLFLRPNYRHYYFGDYYASNYQSGGYYPWYSYNSSHFGYDPLFAHDHWQNRNDRDWNRRVEAEFQNRRDHTDARPLHTLAAQQKLGTSTGKNVIMAGTLAEMAKQKNSQLQIQSVTKAERQKFGQRGQDLLKFGEERQKLETKTAGAPTEKLPNGSTQAKVKFPTSPYVAKGVAELGKDHTPPQRHEVLKPNLNIEAKPKSDTTTPRSETPKKVETPLQPLKVNPTEPKPAPKGVVPKENPKPTAPRVEVPKKVETPPQPLKVKPVEPKIVPPKNVEPKEAPKAIVPRKEAPQAPKAEPKPQPQKGNSVEPKGAPMGPEPKQPEKK